MPTETRYFRSDQQTINGLLAYLLGTSQTATSKYTYGHLVSCSSAYLYPTGDAYAGFPNIYPTTPTTHYDKVDEATADDDATYVYTGTGGGTCIDRYYKTTLSIGTSKIAAVDIIIRYKGRNLQVGFYIGGTLYLSSILPTKSTWTTTNVRWLKNPATGNDWTQNDVNNAQLVVQASPGVGYSTAFTQVYIRVYYYTDDTVYFQFQVFKRDASGNETAITDYITFYSALISVFKDDAGTLRSTTVNIPQTALASTDSIVVRVYTKIGTGSPSMRNVYTTEQLGAQSLDAATWTFYFYLKGANTALAIYDYWYWDTSTYPSRIENFAWTPAVGNVYEIYVDAVVTAQGLIASQTEYNIQKDASINAGSSMEAQSIFNIEKEVLVNPSILPNFEINISLEALVKADAIKSIQSILNVFKDAIVNSLASPEIKSEFNILLSAIAQASAIPEISLAKVKITKIYFLAGNIYIDLSTKEVGILEAKNLLLLGNLVIDLKTGEVGIAIG